MAKLSIQTTKYRTTNDKYRWWIDCGDIDSDMEGYAPTIKAAQEEAGIYASLCPFSSVYIEDADTGEVVDFYWVN